jgi:DNA polymerase-3 subunit beta
MEIICNTQKLKEVLEYAERVVTRHLTLPILNNFLIKTDKNGVTISSTNLEIGVSSWFACKVVKEGEITVPAKIFYGIISSLGSDKVFLEIKKENILNISTDNYKANLKGESANDFPIIPKLKKENKISVNSRIFCRSLSQVVSFVSNSETRPEITGVLVYKEKGEKEIKVVATDSFRLGEKSIKTEDSSKDFEFSVIIPSKTATEIIRIFSEMEGELNLIIEKNQICAELNRTEIVSRLIEGNYPDYKRLIPSSFNMQVNIKRDEFLRTLKLVSLFSNRVNDIGLVFTKGKDQKVRVYATDSDLGENSSELVIEMKGEDIEVRFNWRYLADGVSGMNSEIVILNFIDESKPCLIKSPQDNTFVYIVMPIRA